MVDGTLKPSVKMLREVKLLRRLTDEELQKLVNLGKSMSCEAQTNIVIEGEPSWGLYLILDGAVGIFKTNKLSGDMFEVGHLKAGNFFGEMSLVDDHPRSATVQSLTDTQLFYISKDDFMNLLNQIPDLKLRFYETCIQDLVSRLRELDENYVISQYQLWKVAITGDAA